MYSNLLYSDIYINEFFDGIYYQLKMPNSLPIYKNLNFMNMSIRLNLFLYKKKKQKRVDLFYVNKQQFFYNYKKTVVYLHKMLFNKFQFYKKYNKNSIKTSNANILINLHKKIIKISKFITKNKIVKHKIDKYDLLYIKQNIKNKNNYFVNSFMYSNKNNSNVISSLVLKYYFFENNNDYFSKKNILFFLNLRLIHSLLFNKKGNIIYSNYRKNVLVINNNKIINKKSNFFLKNNKKKYKNLFKRINNINKKKLIFYMNRNNSYIFLNKFKLFFKNKYKLIKKNQLNNFIKFKKNNKFKKSKFIISNRKKINKKNYFNKKYSNIIKKKKIVRFNYFLNTFYYDVFYWFYTKIQWWYNSIVLNINVTYYLLNYTYFNSKKITLDICNFSNNKQFKVMKYNILLYSNKFKYFNINFVVKKLFNKKNKFFNFLYWYCIIYHLNLKITNTLKLYLNNTILYFPFYKKKKFFPLVDVKMLSDYIKYKLQSGFSIVKVLKKIVKKHTRQKRTLFLKKYRNRIRIYKIKKHMRIRLFKNIYNVNICLNNNKINTLFNKNKQSVVFYKKQLIKNKKNVIKIFKSWKKKIMLLNLLVFPLLGIRIELNGPSKKGKQTGMITYNEWVNYYKLPGKMPYNNKMADVQYWQSFARLKRASIGLKIWLFFSSSLYSFSYKKKIKSHFI